MYQDEVRAYYESFGEREWTRLANPEDGAVEWEVTSHFLAKYLPSTARILDLGGGPGRYTIWLAQQGYRVVLADLSPKLLNLARLKIAEAGVAGLVEGIVEVDACRLTHWGNSEFEAVLCLGPFYHLPDPADREQATQELIRVLRPGGVVFIALMSRFSFLRRTLALADEHHHLTNPDWITQLLQEGHFHNEVPGRFNRGYGVQPSEVAPFFERQGLQTLDLVACEGITSGLEGIIVGLAKSEPALYRTTLDLIIQTANDPSILGMAGHLLYVGRKR